MTTNHDEDLGLRAHESGMAHWRLMHWLLLGALVTPLAAGGVAWIARKPIAHAALQSWCEGRSLECDARFDRLGPGRLVLSDLRVASGTAIPFEAASLDARLTWTGLFSPGISAVAFDGPVLRARQAGGRVSLDGLERLVPQGGGGGATPQIDVTNGRLVLATLAGDVNADVSASGRYPDSGQLDIVFKSTSLQGPQGSADIGAGSVSLTASQGRLSGKVLFEVNAADFEAISLSGAILRADLTGVSGGRAETRIDWAASLRSATIDGASLTGLDARGHAELARLGGDSPQAFLAALTEASLEAGVADIKTSGFGSGPASIAANLTGDDGRISGPVRLSASSASAPGGTVRDLAVEGEATLEATGKLAFSGAASLAGAGLVPELRTRFLKPITLPGALAGHGTSARRAFDRGLDDFNSDVRFRAERVDGRLSFDVLGETVLSAASGLEVRITPDDGASWLSVAPGAQAFGGNVSVLGGGAPSLRATIDTLHLDPGGLTLGARDLSIAPWAVSGLTVSTALSALDVTQTPDLLQISGNGQMTLAGDAAGARFRNTVLKGGLEAQSSAAGWQVRSPGRPCLALSTSGVSVGAVTFLPVDLDLCANGGDFVRKGSKVAAGEVTLGDINLPFTMTTGSGTLSLDAATIDWNASKGLGLLVRAETMSLPLEIGERTLSIAGRAPRLDARMGTGPARLSANLDATVFGGTLIPAKVSAQGFRFAGTNARAGISGDLSANGVLIEDFRADPLYRPLRADLTATIADNQLAMSGPLKTLSGRIVADSAVDIDIIKLDGTASVASRDVVFQPGGFQPEDLSGRLVGVFTDAVGAMEASSELTIRSGQIAGTADVGVSGFGFQTTRLGRVSQVDGAVRFSDVMALTTLPGQRITVGSVSPGVRLTDGRIVFGLENGSRLNIESAAFPFAGGVLSVEPLVWHLGGGNERIEVSVTGVQLAELVETLKIPDTKATGTVGGRFPIDFEGADVFIRDARLKAEAPGGRFSYTSGAVNQIADRDRNARLAFGALRDFEFSVLEIGLSGNAAGRMNASMHLAGVNVRPVPLNDRFDIPPGQAFEFTFGFDVPFRQIFTDTSAAFDQRQLIETIIRLRDEEEEQGNPPE